LESKRRRAAWTAGLFLIAAVAWAAWKVPEVRAVRRDADSARRLVAAGKFDEARAPLLRWLKARPDAGEAYFLLARSAIHFGVFDQAFPLLARAEAAGYPWEPIALERARALMRLGRHHEAAPILNQLVFSPAAKPDAAADEAFAQCALESFQFPTAAAAIERWMRDAPRDARPYLWKADVDRRTDAGLSAITEDYEQALARDPGCAPALLNLGEMYLQAHRLDEALARYSAYLARFPDDPAAHLGLGKTLAERGNAAAAVEHLDRAAELDPRDARPLLERARLDIQSGNLERALSFLDRALELDQGELKLQLHYLRSLVLARLGRKTAARSEQEVIDGLRREQSELSKLLKALKASPRDVTLQYNAARWLFDHGHPEEGLRWAEKILREFPSHAETSRLIDDYYRKRDKSPSTLAPQE
jgi:tetratricopeptide (TPR) repeat protein